MHLCVVCRQPILFDDVEDLYAHNSRGAIVTSRREIKNLICDECLEKGWLLSFDGTPVQLKNELPKKGSASNMGELISATEARERTKVELEIIVQNELSKIQKHIDEAIKYGEYCTYIDDTLRPETKQELKRLGYSISGDYQSESIQISWRE